MAPEAEPHSQASRLRFAKWNPRSLFPSSQCFHDGRGSGWSWARSYFKIFMAGGLHFEKNSHVCVCTREGG